MRSRSILIILVLKQTIVLSIVIVVMVVGTLTWRGVVRTGSQPNPLLQNLLNQTMVVA